MASSNLGDGFAWLAFPWLASLLTRDPVLWSRIWTLLGDAVTLLVMGALLRRRAR